MESINAAGLLLTPYSWLTTPVRSPLRLRRHLQTISSAKQRHAASAANTRTTRTIEDMLWSSVVLLSAPISGWRRRRSRGGRVDRPRIGNHAWRSRGQIDRGTIVLTVPRAADGQAPPTVVAGARGASVSSDAGAAGAGRHVQFLRR